MIRAQRQASLTNQNETGIEASATMEAPTATAPLVLAFTANAIGRFVHVLYLSHRLVVALHLGIKVKGRRQTVDLQRLVHDECVWTLWLYSFAYGTPEIETNIPRPGVAITEVPRETEPPPSYRETASGLFRKFAETRQRGERRRNLRRQKEEHEQALKMLFLHTLTLPGSEPGSDEHLWRILKKRWATALETRAALADEKPAWFGASLFAEPKVLSERAEEFCRAKRDARYPWKDKRRSGDMRRIEYMARVLAALSQPRCSVSYGVELLRKMPHGPGCTCWKCNVRLLSREPAREARARRRQTAKRLFRFFAEKKPLQPFLETERGDAGISVSPAPVDFF